MIAPDTIEAGSNAGAGPLPEGPFSAILADPPWSFQVRSAKGAGRSPSQHYDTMSLSAIREMPVNACAAPDSTLFLWVTDTHVPQGLAVMEAWGFTYRTVGFVWAKLNKNAPPFAFNNTDFFMGLGYWTRSNAELCLLGTRGRPKRLPTGRNVRRLIVAPRGPHSRKPVDAHVGIERLVSGPYLELFARAPRAGWTVWGNQTDRFPEATPTPKTEGTHHGP